MKNGAILVLVLFVLWTGILLFLPTKDATPAATAIPTAAATPTTAPSFLSQIDRSTWDYYKLIAFRNEFGSSEAQGVVKKWTTPIYLYIGPNHTPEDLTIIQNHIAAMQAVPGVPTIFVIEVPENANLTVSFISQEEMNRLTESHGEIALGYTTVWWDQTGSITQGEIYIVYDEQTQSERQHTLLEELTQAMGLMNDSILYENSIFYVEYKADLLSLSALDWRLLEIHYAEVMRPGMTENDAETLYTKERQVAE